MKKIIKRTLLILVLIIIYVYTLVIIGIPDNIIIFEGENVKIKTFLGLTSNLKGETKTIETSANNNNTINDTGKATVQVNLFDNIFIKNVNVDVLPRTKVIPVGSIAGVKLYTSGVLVVGMSEIEGIDNKKYKPYENTGIEEGDTIVSVNNTRVSTTEELVKIVNQSKGNDVQIKYVHDENTISCSITPVRTSGREYKLGLWVRDSAARSWNCNLL